MRLDTTGPAARRALLALLLALPAAALASGTTRTPGGEIVAKNPVGWGWKCMSDARTGEGFRLAAIRCFRPVGDVFLRLAAEDYAGPEETLEGICARDWRTVYREVFAELESVQAEVAELGGERVCAVEALGTALDGHPVQVREWYAVVPGHVLLVSGIGLKDAMTANAPVVKTWRRGITFAAKPPASAAEPPAGDANPGPSR